MVKSKLSMFLVAISFFALVSSASATVTVKPIPGPVPGNDTDVEVGVENGNSNAVNNDVNNEFTFEGSDRSTQFGGMPISQYPHLINESTYYDPANKGSRFIDLFDLFRHRADENGIAEYTRAEIEEAAKDATKYFFGLLGDEPEFRPTYFSKEMAPVDKVKVRLKLAVVDETGKIHNLKQTKWSNFQDKGVFSVIAFEDEHTSAAAFAFVLKRAMDRGYNCVDFFDQNVEYEIDSFSWGLGVGGNGGSITDFSSSAVMGAGSISTGIQKGSSKRRKDPFQKGLFGFDPTFVESFQSSGKH
ncbi:hypothetical protein ACFL2R_00985 [Patescibacteria group bacterium]